MSKSSSRELTHLLRAWRRGEREALDKLIPVICEELRRISHSYLDGSRVNRQNRAHFGAVPARLMRLILIDCVRSRCAHGDARNPNSQLFRYTMKEELCGGNALL